MTSFSDRILSLKNEKSVLQKTIADSIGISLRALQRYEKGETQPTLPVLVALADFFDVSIDYLVGRTDNPAVNR